MMINSIIEAIAIALNGEFGDDYRVYVERERQDLKEPCFFISCLNPTHTRILGRRYFRENSFVIQYFPQDRQREKEECNDTAERLNDCLEWITVKGDNVEGDPVMGSQMRYEIVDGVLNFFVHYNFFVVRPRTVETMGSIEIFQSEKSERR